MINNYDELSRMMMSVYVHCRQRVWSRRAAAPSLSIWSGCCALYRALCSSGVDRDWRRRTRIRRRGRRKERRRE